MIPPDDRLARDPGGWAAALLTAHGLAAGPLEAMQGWSNQIWATETHVVRIASGRFAGSLSHEAAVLNALAHAPCPRVVASGEVGERQWMIQTRLPGADLLKVWPSLDLAEREQAVRSLAQTLRAIHETPLSPALQEPPWRAAAVRPGGDLSLALRIPPARYPLLLEASRTREAAPAALLERTGAFIAERLACFADDREALTHGDATFANVIWDGETSALIDFESAGAAPIDRELDLLLRFLSDPSIVRPGASGASQDLSRYVVGWLRDAYPELFAHPSLVQRLEAYDALWELTQLLNFPTDHPRQTQVRLETIVAGNAPWKAALTG